MRAIVSLFKFYVGASFLFSAAVLAFILGLAMSGLSDMKYAGFGVLGIYGAVAGFLTLLLLTGIAALLISAHDRLSDMTVLMSERNDILRNGGSALRGRD